MGNKSQFSLSRPASDFESSQMKSFKLLSPSFLGNQSQASFSSPSSDFESTHIRLSSSEMKTSKLLSPDSWESRRIPIDCFLASSVGIIISNHSCNTKEKYKGHAEIKLTRNGLN